MKILLVLIIIIVPVLMTYLHYQFTFTSKIFNLLAFISFMIFSSITATTVYQIIIDDKLFMTTIHKLFIQPFFLLTGGFIGLFVLYQLLLLIVKDAKEKEG